MKGDVTGGFFGYNYVWMDDKKALLHSKSSYVYVNEK